MEIRYHNFRDPQQEISRLGPIFEVNESKYAKPDIIKYWFFKALKVNDTFKWKAFVKITPLTFITDIYPKNPCVAKLIIVRTFLVMNLYNVSSLHPP